MNAQYKKGIVETCLLALVEKGHQSAYQITLAMKANVSVTENTVYPMLRRLTEKDYLIYEKEKIEAGAPIKKYQLTALGLKHLNEERESWNQFVKEISTILGESNE